MPIRAHFRLHDRAITALLVCGAFALWLATLTQRSVWVDELSTTIVLAQRDLPSLINAAGEAERRPPLYFVLLWLWQNVAGSNEFTLRYASLFFLTLSLPTFGALVRQASQSSRAAVFVAISLFAISPTLALYGVMIRYYALVLWLALALSVIYLRLLQAARPVFRCILGWWLVALSLIYTDYSALALIGAQTLWLVVWLWRQRRAATALTMCWGVMLGALALAYVPQLSRLSAQAGRDLTEADLARGPLGVALKFLHPLFSFTFGETILPWHLAVLTAAPFVALALGAALRLMRAQSITSFALLNLLVPLTFNVFVVTSVATDISFLSVASRTLFVLPFFVMALAVGIAALPTRWRALSLGALLVANGFALFNLFRGAQYHNPIYAVPLRAVVETIRVESRLGDVVIADGDIAFHYYWQQQSIPNTTFYFGADVAAAQAQIQLTRAPRIWLLTFGRDRTRSVDRTDEFVERLAHDYQVRAEQQYAPVDPLYRILKEWLVGRETYSHKLTVRLFVRTQ